MNVSKFQPYLKLRVSPIVHGQAFAAVVVLVQIVVVDKGYIRSFNVRYLVLLVVACSFSWQLNSPKKNCGEFLFYSFRSQARPPFRLSVHPSACHTAVVCAQVCYYDFASSWLLQPFANQVLVLLLLATIDFFCISRPTPSDQLVLMFVGLFACLTLLADFLVVRTRLSY